MLGIHIEDEIFPVTRHRLEVEFEGRYENVPVWRRSFSKQRRIGLGSAQMIRVLDAAHGGNPILPLQHESDDRDLPIEYAERTLVHLYTHWGRNVALQTSFGGPGIRPCRWR